MLVDSLWKEQGNYMLELLLAMYNFRLTISYRSYDAQGLPPLDHMFCCYYITRLKTGTSHLQFGCGLFQTPTSSHTIGAWLQYYLLELLLIWTNKDLNLQHSICCWISLPTELLAPMPYFQQIYSYL